jgi:hypothetical protein
MLHVRSTYRLIPITDIIRIEKVEEHALPIVELVDCHRSLDDAEGLCFASHEAAQQAVDRVKLAIMTVPAIDLTDKLCRYVRLIPASRPLLVCIERNGGADNRLSAGAESYKFFDEFKDMTGALEEFDRQCQGFEVLQLDDILPETV